MDVAGLVLAVIAEVRTVNNMIKTRYANVSHGPDTFKGLTDELEKLMQQVDAVEKYVRSVPASDQTGIRAVFLGKVTAVRDTLKSCDATLQNECSKAFKRRKTGSSSKVKSFIRRATRATTLHDTMDVIRLQVRGAFTELDSLLSTLVTEQNIQEGRDVVLTALDDMRIVKEAYSAGASTPNLPLGTTLDFDAKDEDGKLCTPEGILKEAILSEGASSRLSAAVGVCAPAHGVVGMAGVGKTTALQGLAFDKDIRDRFPDGVQYIALGHDATVSTTVEAIAKILRLTGASASVVAVKESALLRDAVDYAVAWFDKKNCLFLVDDLWPTAGCETGYLNDLRQLLRSCSESRMAITTRSTKIADAAGRSVDFAPRAPLGAVSVNMFMMHAKRDSAAKAPQEPSGDQRRSIVKILTLCAGLPIALAVAGSTVGFITREQGDFEGACDEYATLLEEQRIALGEEESPGGRSLNAALSLTLNVLEAKFVKLKSRNAIVTDQTIADLYTSLCVLRRQAWIPISVLCRIWNVEKEFALDVVHLLRGLSLCKLTFRERAQGLPKERGLMLRDLQLDYCRRQADTTKTTSVWHSRLLNGYLVPVPSAAGGSLLTEQDDSFELTLLAYASRPWWEVAYDGYIHTGVARHLVSANLELELGALLLDARWMHERAVNGGILALKSDFETFLTLGGDNVPRKVSQSIEFIWNAVQLSWGRLSDGERPFLFYICGRLLYLRKGNAIVDSYLKGVEARTPVPYLAPANLIFADPRSAQGVEIPVGGSCEAVDCSPCGRYIAAGAGKAVVVADALTGKIVKHFEGHSKNVLCVSFASGSKKIVSGSEDNSVAVWEWETSESPVQVFQGHSQKVTVVAVSSDAAKIFSCSADGTMMIWDAKSGAQVGEFAQQCRVWTVAVSNDDRTVAIGLDNGAMKVLNSSTGYTIFEAPNAHESVIYSVAFSANGQRLATGSVDRTIRVWDTATWTSIGNPFEGHTGSVACVTCSPDGRQIASGSSDGTVRLWDSSSGRNIWRSSNVRAVVASVAFTPDGGKVISGSEDGTVCVWDTSVEAEGNEDEYFHFDPVCAVAISRDGLRVASGSEDGTVRLWDSRTGNQIGSPLEGHTDELSCVSFSPDGRQVVSGSHDDTLRLWDAETLSQMGDPVEGHTSSVQCVSFSSDGLRIIAGSFDKNVRVWDAGSRKQIGDALEGHRRQIEAVSESSDGCYVVSRGDDGVVVIWDRSNRTIIWKSQVYSSSKLDNDTTHELTDEEAESIIRSCGQDTPHLWPDSFPAYSPEVYCRNGAVRMYPLKTHCLRLFRLMFTRGGTMKLQKCLSLDCVVAQLLFVI